MITVIAIYLCLGAVAGILAGLLGVGGGLIIVPVLLWVFSHLGFDAQTIMQISVATSLATILLTSAVSTYAHHRHGAVEWRIVWQLTPGILIGAAIGAIIADYLPGDILKTIFAVFEIMVAIQMIRPHQPQAANALPGRMILHSAGLVTGSVSAILGIGGGTLTVPFLLWCQRSIRQAVASSAACGFPIALSGAIFYMLLGLDEPNLPEATMGYIYWPALVAVSISSVIFAPLGAKWAHTLPVQTLKKIFALLLVFIGMRMLLF